MIYCVKKNQHQSVSQLCIICILFYFSSRNNNNKKETLQSRLEEICARRLRSQFPSFGTFLMDKKLATITTWCEYKHRQQCPSRRVIELLKQKGASGNAGGGK